MCGHSILIALWALVLSMIHNGTQLCSGCFLEEQRALLNFKASLNVTKNAHPVLPSWTGKEGDGANTDCCSWERVKCSNITGRIVELHLSNVRVFTSEEYYPYYYQRWYLNISTLIPLKYLRSLHLSNSVFAAAVTGNHAIIFLQIHGFLKYCSRFLCIIWGFFFLVSTIRKLLVNFLTT